MSIRSSVSNAGIKAKNELAVRSPYLRHDQLVGFAEMNESVGG